MYGVREDGKEVVYDLGKSYLFLDTAGDIHFEQIKKGKTYQFTVTGMCFGNEIVLNHIVQINNPNEMIEQRERKGFQAEKFFFYFGIIWFMVIFFSVYTALRVIHEKSSIKICLLIGTVIGAIVTFVLLMTALFVW